jgi:ABC-type multidrug transport system fused ATPase/permease subunit
MLLELFFVLSFSHIDLSTSILLHEFSAAIAFAANIVILLMPFRPAALGLSDVSPVGVAPTHDLRSPEDNLKLYQFFAITWMEPMIVYGKSHMMGDGDVWKLAYQFQHRRLFDAYKHVKGTLMTRLIKAYGVECVCISLLAVAELICEFAAPVMLKQILKAMKNEHRDLRRVAFFYATLALLFRITEAQIEQVAHWYCRKVYERSRGSMIMEVYAKALVRKDVVALPKEEAREKVRPTEELEMGNGNGVSNGVSNGEANGTSAANGAHPTTKKEEKKRSWIFDVPGLFNIWKKEEPKLKEPASMGKVLNLVKGDVYEIAQRFWDLGLIVKVPIAIVFATVLIWTFVGPSCFIAIIAVFISQIVTYFLAKVVVKLRLKTKIAKDKRLQVTSQFIEVIRHLRYYSWTDYWLEQLYDARNEELRRRVHSFVAGATMFVVSQFTTVMFPVIALASYTIMTKKPLSIEIIFPALQLFNLLNYRLHDVPMLVTSITNAYVSVGRIEDFMAEPEKDSGDALPLEDDAIKLEDCSYCWPETAKPVLQDVSIEIKKGLTLVVGRVGSGKSALLHALLGEMDKISGEAHLPSNEVVGYCAQTPWLQSMSIRDNILFYSDYDQDRYDHVVDACELVVDFKEFADGDKSFIGENGIGLSGGQRARLALARALYSQAEFIFLDDPLSALDQNTAESIAIKCFRKDAALLQNRAIVLVTHRVDILNRHASLILEVVDKKVKSLAPSTETLNRLEEIEAENYQKAQATDSAEEDSSKDPEKEATKFMSDEFRAEWNVQTRVYWTYIKAGRLKWWALMGVTLVLHRLSTISESWFLKEWGEAYPDPESSFFSYAHWSNNMHKYRLPSFDFGRGSTFFASADGGLFDTKSLRLFGWLPDPGENVTPWLWMYFGIGMLQTVALTIFYALELTIIYCAAKNMFVQAMNRLAGATFRYYDITPVGRLMNRVTSDMGTIDGKISQEFSRLFLNILVWTSSIIVIASVTPLFIAFSIGLMSIFIVIFARYLPTSQNLRRLEMVSLSPLFANFGELLRGLSTVRAFQVQDKFQNRVIEVVDKFQAPDHFYWSLQFWMMWRFSNLSALSEFILTVLALWTNMTPGLTAFTLISASSFVSTTHSLCRRYGELQMDFISVERIDELMRIEQEPTGDLMPPASWPAFNAEVVFEGVTIRYAEHQEPALKDIDVTIPGGSTTVVVGRTGSGKSTLTAAILGIVRPEKGRVIIDGIDVNKVNINELRKRVTFVAQDPVLFQGTIRHNLDPVKEFTDEECKQVLERVCHTQVFPPEGEFGGWTLDTAIEAAGRNLSQGQRQLIGITRAVLRRSSVVILDEATASVDVKSADEVMKVLRSELSGSTVITVAHRVEAIGGADFEIKLDKGSLVRSAAVAAV